MTQLERIKAARKKVAALVVRDPAFLPIFERLERGVAVLEAQEDALSRARAIAAEHNTPD